VTGADEADTALGAAGALVAQARQAVAAGGAVDFALVAEKVDAACRALRALDAAEARPRVGRLAALYDDLGVVTAALEREYRTLQRSLGEIEARRRARTAYGAPPRRTP